MNHRLILAVFFGLLAVVSAAVLILLVQSSAARKALRVAESIREEQIAERAGYDSFIKNGPLGRNDDNYNSDAWTRGWQRAKKERERETEEKARLAAGNTGQTQEHAADGKEAKGLLAITSTSKDSAQEEQMRPWLIAGKKIEASFKEKLGDKLIFLDAAGNEFKTTFEDLPTPDQEAVMAISGWGHLWHDSTWKHTTIAHLINIVGDRIVLEQPNGNQITVLIDRLSAVDRKYVDQQRDRFAKLEQLAEEKRIDDQARADASAKEAVERAEADAKKAIELAKTEAAAKSRAEKEAKRKRQLSRVENRYVRLRGKKPTEVDLKDKGVLVGDIYWSVHEATVLGDTIPSQSPFRGSLKTSGTFIWVEVWVENKGKAPITLIAPNVFDDNARLFSSSTDAIFYFPQDKLSGFLHNLNPGVRTQAVFVYDVPDDATGLTLLVGDLELFKGEEGAIDLGL